MSSMADCGDVDCSTKHPSPSKLMKEVVDSCAADCPTNPECAICLQSCVHPVRLPCCHVFCFLCVKGASWHSKRCALCRQDFPEDFLEKPVLISPEELKAAAAGMSRNGGAGGDSAWYYEGRNGWWQYDERTSRELEEAFANERKSTEMLIAGFLYVADLENMVQYRRNEHGRRRKIKRDLVDIPKKGVAGLRLDPEPVLPVGTRVADRVSSADGADTAAPSVLGYQPPRPQPTLEESLSQLLISRPEEEDEDRDNQQNNQTYESISSESDGENHEPERGRAERRHQEESELTRMPQGGGASSSVLSLRSRSPDGQCTVTEV